MRLLLVFAAVTVVLLGVSLLLHDRSENYSDSHSAFAVTSGPEMLAEFADSEMGDSPPREPGLFRQTRSIVQHGSLLRVKKGILRYS